MRRDLHRKGPLKAIFERVSAATHAHGLRVPKAIGDFLMLKALRSSHGAGIAVSEAEIVQGVKDAAAAEGLGALSRDVSVEGRGCVFVQRRRYGRFGDCP